MKARRWILLLLALVTAGACPWSNELREYLSAHFWLPFAKHSASFEHPNVERMDEPYAGMTAAQGGSPLARLRAAYQQLQPAELYMRPPRPLVNVEPLRQAVAAARADRTLSPRDKEEVDLIEAKIEMRGGETGQPALLQGAKQKLQAFLRTARTPEFASEARGWLAHIHYLLGDQTAAGKIYLDELNRPGSNLSRETLLNSLQMNYGYNGGSDLIAHLDEYFDTPEHAAFAIQLVTNPRRSRELLSGRFALPHDNSETYRRIQALLASHKGLLQSDKGANTLALLSVRTALRMGDPAAARAIAQSIPAAAAIRTAPDYLWMSASAHFLSREYAASEQPLLALFRSSRASDDQRAAAAYALCGVYEKTLNVAGQLRFALWLRAAGRSREFYMVPSSLADLSIYWASSGWDLGLILESSAPTAALESFVAANPNLADIRLVRYALAVRLAREDRYRESAEIYESIQANRRAQRMRKLASLQHAMEAPGLRPEALLEALYEFAAYLAANPERLYFNDTLWSHMQRYALHAAQESRLTGVERGALVEGERKLRDSQEEGWRAYLILEEVARDAGPGPLRTKAARLALRCLQGINTERFGREADIASANKELLGWLSHR
ncbi:hypothetical protein [Paludibaculum fermentans]|uniref:hypothetical protein n=1 Tax=Paludibaculum fermentans TaxID=1473598 RepID=UPI003EBD2067